MRTIDKKKVAGSWDAARAATDVQSGAALRVWPALSTPDRSSSSQARPPAHHGDAGHGRAQGAARS